MGIPYRKQEKTPKYSANQQQQVEELSDKLANNLNRSSVEVIMDNESTSLNRATASLETLDITPATRIKYPDKVRFTGKEKYPTMVLIWIAISARGISKSLFSPSKSEAIDSDIYINECLAKRLLPFTSIIQT